MNARMLRRDWLGGRAGLLGVLMILGLGCGSSPPAAQEPAAEPQPAEVASEPANEPAPGTTPDSPDVAPEGPAAEPEQASAQQPPAPAQASAQQPAAEPVPEPTGKLLQLIQDSEKAGREGRYGKAHRLCSQALDMDARQPRAVNVCAIAACNLRNARLAKQYYALATTEDQQKNIFVICHARGIELRE